jgi:hypothetical protein
MDSDSIPLGRNYTTVINRVLGECNVVLAIIAKDWLAARDTKGRRRLDLDTDWVRIELETALARDIAVIPILVGDAELPSVEELPPSLRELVRRQFYRIRPDRDFGHDVESLGDGIERTTREESAFVVSADVRGAPEREDTPQARPEADTSIGGTSEISLNPGYESVLGREGAVLSDRATAGSRLRGSSAAVMLLVVCAVGGWWWIRERHTAVKVSTIAESAPVIARTEVTADTVPKVGPPVESAHQHGTTAAVAEPAVATAKPLSIGTVREDVRAVHGEPTVVKPKGYWRNSSADVYDVVHDQVMVSYIFDNDTHRARQVEVSYSVDPPQTDIALTLISMISSVPPPSMPGAIRDAVEKFVGNPAKPVEFSYGGLVGELRRKTDGHVFLAVWEPALHQR